VALSWTDRGLAQRHLIFAASAFGAGVEALVDEEIAISAEEGRAFRALVGRLLPSQTGLT